MILARGLCSERRDDLALGFARMGLPTAACEYVLEKAPHFQVLLTGLGVPEGRFLRALPAESLAPGREEFPSFVAGDQRVRPGTALLSGRKEQLERVISRAEKESLTQLAQALRALLLAEDPPAAVELGGRRFEFGARTYVMGIVNVTPDSFSDGGRFSQTDAALAQALSLEEAGADLLDLGGESTRPGAAPVSAEEELGRVVPVIEALAKRTRLPLSIDTTKSEVAERALAAGASFVNDVTGFQGDPKLAEVTAKAGAGCCLMHMQGTPRTMQAAPRYDDVVEEVVVFLRESMRRAEQAGIPRSRIWVDPGIGFGKTDGQNLTLLRRIQDLRVLGVPILVGTSRKAFLGKLAGGKPPEGRLSATLGSVAAVAALGGVDVVRVHDVAECRDALSVATAIRHARGAGELFLKPLGSRSPEHAH